MQKNVMILGINDSGEKVSAASARISTTTGDAFSTFENSSDKQKNQSLIKKVLQSGHSSIAEHTVFNIAFCNVSAFVEQFMIEFRLASFTVKSRRYVDFGDTGFYTPSIFQNNKKYLDHVNELFALYNELIQNDIPKEDARFLLPYCFYSNFYVTVNARELIHILESMLNGRGSIYEEIKNIGLQLLKQAMEISPAFFESIQPQNEYVEQSEKYVEHKNVYENIKIISSTPDPMNVLKIASSISGRQAVDISDIIKSSRPRELEQLTYTIQMNGLSLSSITHLVRHRMQSVIVPPLTAINHENYIIPNSIAANDHILSRYNKAFDDTKKLVDELLQKGIKREDLVYLSLSGHTLNVMTTMNVRELLLFFKLRTCNRAQWEIRGYSIELLQKLRVVSPDIFNKIGPSCFVDDKCPEGRLSCGHMQDIIKIFTVI